MTRALSSRAKRSPRKVRLHPLLEVAVNSLWLKRLREMDSDDGRTPTPEEMLGLCRELASKVKPFRGRPAHSVLTHHVHGLMALVQETCGSPATASRTRNSVYDPHMVSLGGQVIETVFRGIDPAISVTALVNIVLNARSLGATEGKRFRDFFPFYDSEFDAATGDLTLAPGLRLEGFELVPPIYCS
ncbi:hypothetical protein [Sphingomonas prati]|nr:hypothetical protein [Sphingomonas prati]